jgi:hypothetical protein
MTTTISPYDYCKHPEDYINSPGIDNVTRIYWDQYCSALNASQGPPITNSRNGFSSFKDFADRLGNAVPEAMLQFVIGILTLPIQNVPFTNVPMYESIIPGIIGSKLLKPIGNLVKAIGEKGVSKPIQEAGEEALEADVDTVSINMGTMAQITKEVVEEDAGLDIAEGATYSAGKYSVEVMEKGMLEAVGDGLIAMGDGIKTILDLTDPAMEVMMVLQMIGMIVDGMDPCNLKLQLDAGQLQTFTNSFNDTFRDTVMVKVESTLDSYGRVSVNANWPIPYYAEFSALLPFKPDYYKKMESKLVFQYLSTLTHNSDGYPIYKAPKGKLVTGKEISGIALKRLSFFSNNNTVVENWLSKYWPILVAILIAIFVLVLVIKIKNVKKNV